MHCSLQKSKFRTSYWYSEHDASCNTFLLCVIPQYRTERHLEFWTTGSHRRGRSLSPKIKAVCLHEGHFIKKANGICRMEITICQNEVKILCIKWPTYEVIIITVLKEFEVKYILSEDSFFKRDFIHLFLERGREGEREEKKHQCVVGLSGAPLLGACPAAQACAPTGNQTSHPLVHRLVLNPLSHTGQGYLKTLYKL